MLIFIAAQLAPWLANQSHTIDPDLQLDMDRQSCEQMRDSGWTEVEIQVFMLDHDGTYFKQVN